MQAGAALGKTGFPSNPDAVSAPLADLTQPQGVDRRSSQEILESITPRKPETYAELKKLLTDYCGALQVQQSPVQDLTHQGQRFGSEVNLTQLDPSVRTIVVGDLHGEIHSLKAILLDKENLQDIANGRAVLMLLGDIVHPVRGDPYDMGPSWELKMLVMALTTAYPRNVFALVGNHDPVDTECRKKMLSADGSLVKLNQGSDFRKYLASMLEEVHATSHETQEFLQTYAESTCLSPYFFVAQGVVGVHAGPISLSRQVARDCSPLDGDAMRAFCAEIDLDDVGHRTYYEACWQRLSPTECSPEFISERVGRFLSECEQPNGHLIVGHSPPKDKNKWREDILCPDKDGTANGFTVIIASGQNVLGYAELGGSGLNFRDIPLPK